MIIVTGGAGFIGSAIVAALNSRSISDILIVDNLAADEKWKNLRRLFFSDYLEKEDFLKMIVNGQVELDIDTIFHLGAISSTTERDATLLIRNNYEYTKVLAGWATEKNIRFIYASSAATYGDGSRGFVDDHSQLGKLEPLNMYGYSKHLFDLWAQKTGLLKKIVGLKYFNVFGPNEYHKGSMMSFVPKAYEQIKETDKVKLFKSYDSSYPDGGQMRDFVYIRDAVDMTLFFYNNPEIYGLFNIGTGNARTWDDLARAVFAAMDKPEKIEYVDMPESIRDRYQYFTRADVSKIRKAGYNRKPMSLEEAIKDYVCNYLSTNSFLSGV